MVVLPVLINSDRAVRIIRQSAKSGTLCGVLKSPYYRCNLAVDMFITLCVAQASSVAYEVRV